MVIKENMEVRHDNVFEEVRYHAVEKKSTKTTIPFVKNNNFDYAQLVNWAGEYKEEAAWLPFMGTVPIMRLRPKVRKTSVSLSALT